MRLLTTVSNHYWLILSPGSTNWKGRLSTIDFLFRIACSVKSSWSKLVGTRRSIVIPSLRVPCYSHPLQSLDPRAKALPMFKTHCLKTRCFYLTHPIDLCLSLSYLSSNLIEVIICDKMLVRCWRKVKQALPIARQID